MLLSERGCIMKTIFTLFLFALSASYVSSVAVMSVDLGAEWMKVAIVSPGVPMGIALNKESKRKTPVAVAFRNNERTFGEDALSVGVRFPSLCYTYFLDLLGKDVNNPIVKLFQKRFPYYNIVPDPARNTVLFKHDDEIFFSPEELVAMLLSKAREFAVESARQPVNDVVLTVPGYFNQAERKAMIIAAEMAGLKVLQLINGYTASALNYGIFRRKDFNETAQYVMLYDMGAYSTSAVIISYQTVKTKEKGFLETNPQLQVIGVGYDRTLGGLEMQLRLRDYLGKKFNELKKTNKSVFENARAMAKLFKEAGRLKLILSANQEYYAQVESLIDEIDFKLLVQREEFENLCRDLFERVKNPIERALKNAQVSMDIISQVILVGAGTRVPAVQEKLVATVNTELRKNLNTDEAAVMGAAYKAADLSTGFKVKKFVTKDAVLYPILVKFERSETEKGSKQVSRTLFNHMNPYPQKKILTFNKHQNDFEFHVQYGDLESAYPDHEIEAIGSKILHKVKLNGVSEAIKKHQGNQVESKGIKAHFNLDESGILTMTTVEYHVEKTLSAEELAAQEGDKQSTFSKLSSTISKLFQAAEDELKETNPDIKVSSTKTPTEEEDNNAGKSKPVHEDPESEKKPNFKESSTNKTESEDEKNVTSKEDIDRKPKVVVLKEPIESQIFVLTVPDLSGDRLNESVNKIKALDEFDEKKSRREGALNALESAVIDTRTKIEDDEFVSFAKPDEADNISTKSREIADWLEDEGYSAEADVLENKLEELKKILKPVQHRYKQFTERPDALKTLDRTLNSTSLFLTSMKNFTEQLNATIDDPKYTLYTTVEIETLEKLVNDTLVWKEVSVKQQETMKKSDEPVLSLSSISEKIVSLDREVTYLANKSKNWRPPPTSDKSKENERKKKNKKKDKTGTSEEVISEEVEDTSKETGKETSAEDETAKTTDENKPSHVEL